jgi:hydrogenase maturation protease
MIKTIVIGYGNPDRQDDGVAWHVLAEIARCAGLSAPASPDADFMLLESSPALLFVLQLTPELAETLAGFSRVCFIDAHTGRVRQDVHMEPVKPVFQTSPLTHHLTPESLLALTKSLYQAAPDAVLVSVRGYQFGFAQELSPKTDVLAAQAVKSIMLWLGS